MSQITRPVSAPPRRRIIGTRRRHRNRLAVLAAIAAGGALGAPARYGVARVVPVTPGELPWATLATNVTGSLALGVVLVLLLERFPPSRYLRPSLATGFLGAYTTYSTFAVETVMLVHDGHPTIAIAYTAASITAGLAAAWAGIAIARRLPLPTGARP